MGSSIRCLSSYPRNSIYQKPAGQEPVAINPEGQTKVGQGRERLSRQQATPYTPGESTGWAAPRVFCFLWNSKPKLKPCLCIPAKLGEMRAGLVLLGRNTRSLPGVISVTDISLLHVFHPLFFSYQGPVTCVRWPSYPTSHHCLHSLKFTAYMREKPRYFSHIVVLFNKWQGRQISSFPSSGWDASSINTNITCTTY